MKAALAILAVLLLLGWPHLALAVLAFELGACALLALLIRRAVRGWPHLAALPGRLL